MIAFSWKCGAIAGLSLLVASLANAQNATTACPGICTEEGDEMLNAGDQFTIDGQTATCGYFDSKNTEVTDEALCAENAQKAADAGCKCGIPIDCPGICNEEGDEMLNAGDQFTIDGQTATCGFFDSKNTEVIDEEICDENAQKAADAGCKCGIPIDCPGICTEEGDEMLNAADQFTIDGQTATCGYFDSEAQKVIDEEICDENAQKASDAGCICGTPIVCPGICDEGEELLNAADQFTIDGESATCGYFDSKAQESIIEEECAEMGKKARNAGCNCTGEYPDDTSAGSRVWGDQYMPMLLLAGSALLWSAY